MGVASNINKELLDKLNVGDVLIVGDMLPGISDEELSWTVLNISSKGAVTFQISWFNIEICRRACKVSKGDVIWVEASNV